MKRFLNFGLVTAMLFGLLTIGGSSVCLAKDVTLKLAHFMPAVHVQHREAFEPFAKKVEELSNGSVKVKIYPGGSLGNPKTMVDAIKAGITDIGFVLPSYVPGRFERSSVFELPFLFDSATHLTKVMYDIYDEQFSEDYKDFKVLWFLASPLTQIQTTKKAVLTAADLQGLTIRTGNNTETIALKNLKANPVALPISELSISLQKGVVDGAVVPYAGISSYKLTEMINHISEVNLAGSLMCVLMNKRKWNSLSDDQKKVIDQVAGEQMGLVAAGAFDNEDKINIEKSKGKIAIHKLSDDVMNDIRDANSSIYSEWVEKMDKKGLNGAAILEAVKSSAASTH